MSLRTRRLRALLAALGLVAGTVPPVTAEPVSVIPAVQDVAQEPAKKQEPSADRDPVRQLSRQYARRAAAASHRRAATSITPPTAEEIQVPVVALSQEHRTTCLKFLGDSLPAGTLPDVEGQPHTLADVLGERLTVVVFWSVDNPYAFDQFQELRNELAPLSERGVRAVAIHVGTPPEDYPQLCQQHGERVLCLTDAEGDYFAQLATRKLPRTYLLSAEGKILWLDLEYSRTTRYDLRNALHYYLQEREADAASP